MLNSIPARLILLLVLSMTAFWAYKPDQRLDQAAPLTKTQALAQSCASCHGVESNGLVPRLEGQNEAFIIKALYDFQQGSRSDSAMVTIAKTLKPDDIVNIAQHYARIKIPPGKIDPLMAKVPIVESCTSCHRLSPPLVNPEWPNLAGQKKQYFLKSLNDFRQGHRQSPAMAPIAKGLSPADMEMLADFFARIK